MSVVLVQRDPRQHHRTDDRLYIYSAARAIARGPVVRFFGRNALRILAVLLAHPGAVVARAAMRPPAPKIRRRLEDGDTRFPKRII